MESRINKMLVLDDDRKFLVMDQGLYQGRSFLLVNGVSADEEELTDEILILEETNINGEIDVESVEDEELLTKLVEFFAQ